MTIQVVRNDPEPVVQPPTTYNITGLTYDQAAIIRDVLGTIPHGNEWRTNEVYRALFKGLPGVGVDYEFTADVSPIAKRVTVLHPNPLG